jgi:hypothetical protein
MGRQPRCAVFKRGHVSLRPFGRLSSLKRSDSFLYSGLFASPPLPATATFTRAGTAYHKNTCGCLALCAANEARYSGMRRVENLVPNPEMTGAVVGVVGSGGALPTGWASVPAGLAIEVISNNNGVLRLRLYGTATSTQVQIFPTGFATTSALVASSGQNWGARTLVKFISGTGLNGVRHVLSLYGSSNNYLANTTGPSFTPHTTPGVETAVWHVAVLSNASLAEVLSPIDLLMTNGATVDYTIELRQSQAEKLHATATTLSEYGVGAKYYATQLDGTALPGPFGLLMEHSTTNLIFPSNLEMAVGKWSPTDGSACTTTLNAALAPDGTLTATKQIPTVTSNNKYLFKTFAGAVNTQYCASVYVKASNIAVIPRARIGLGNTAFQNLDRHVNIDLTTGALTPAAGTAPDFWGMEALADGWFRVWVVATSDADGGNYVLHIDCVNSASTTVFAGDGTSGIFVWGVMVEANRTSPSSVIQPTTTAAVVRAVDQVVSGSLPKTTNLYRYSEDFSQPAWTKGSSSTITAHVIDGPGGALTADLFAGSGAGVGYISQNVNGTTGMKLTYSIYAKKAATSVVRTLYTGTVFNSGGSNLTLDWNLDTGVVTLSAAAITAGVAAYMENAGGGWWRLISTAAPTTTGPVECQLIRFYGNSDSVYFWGAQAEQQDTVSPYVLTGAATAMGPRQANTAKFTYTDGTTEVANWNGTRTESTPKVLQSIKVRKA